MPDRVRVRRGAYPLHVRLDAVKAVSAGQTYADVCARVGCTPETLMRWCRTWARQTAAARSDLESTALADLERVSRPEESLPCDVEVDVGAFGGYTPPQEKARRLRQRSAGHLQGARERDEARLARLGLVKG